MWGEFVSKLTNIFEETGLAEQAELWPPILILCWRYTKSSLVQLEWDEDFLQTIQYNFCSALLLLIFTNHFHSNINERGAISET